VIDIPVPALRERREDIPLLVECFLDRHNRRYRRKKQFNREAMRRILDYPWPGNVRELENAVERAFVLSGGNVIKDADLPPEILTSPSPSSVVNGGPLRSEQTFSPGASGGSAPSAQTSATDAGVIPIPPDGLDLDARLRDMEKACYEGAIRRKDGNREAAARLLGVKPHTFRKRAKEKFRL